MSKYLYVLPTVWFAQQSVSGVLRSITSAEWTGVSVGSGAVMGGLASTSFRERFDLWVLIAHWWGALLIHRFHLTSNLINSCLKLFTSHQLSNDIKFVLMTVVIKGDWYVWSECVVHHSMSIYTYTAGSSPVTNCTQKVFRLSKIHNKWLNEAFIADIMSCSIFFL